MRPRWALLGVGIAAAAAACSLTTSFDGLTTGGPATDGGTSLPESGGPPDSSVVDGGADAMSPDGGASAYRAAVLADSPLAYFRFEDTGPVAKDETGAHDGTYKGTETHVPGAIAAEPSGTAASFDGTSWVEVGNVLPFTGNAPFTIEAWASPSLTNTDPMCIAAKTFAPGGASGSVADGWTFFVSDATNKLVLSRFVGSNPTGADGPAILNGRFTHVVATYDGTNGAIFIDGVRKVTAASTTALAATTSPVTIGTGRGGVYCYFHGALDEVAIYGTALGDARITAHFMVGSAK